MNCPLCGDKEKKFAINLKTGAWNCMHANKCGGKGSFWELQKKLGDEPERVEVDRFLKKKKFYSRPKPIKKEVSSPEMSYLYSRGFDDKTISRFGLSGNNGIIHIPYYKDGELVNIKHRPLDKSSPMWTEKNAEPCLFGRDLVKGEILYICEGEYDAMALYQIGFDDGSVSVSNGVNDFRWIDTEWEWLDRFREIYLIMDMDDAGRNAAIELSNKLGTWRCKDVQLPYKDVNECLMNGVTIEQLSECMYEAREYTPAKLMNIGEIEEEIVSIFDDGMKRYGTETLWKQLTDILGGWRESEVTVWTGNRGGGKSTILLQHTLDMSTKGISCCVASLEMPAPRYFMWGVIQYLRNSDPTEEEIRRASRELSKHIYLINSYESLPLSEIIESFEYAARRFNCKHFIIDSLMKIKRPGIKELQEEAEILNTISDFAKKYRAHVHLVAHPRKQESDEKHLDMVDIKGSGQIIDLADNIIAHSRPSEEQINAAKEQDKFIASGLIRILKNRYFGEHGRIKLTYDARTKRYSDDFEEREAVRNERQRSY